MDQQRRTFLLASIFAIWGGRPALGAQRIHIVRLSKMAFGPMPARARVGDVVEWVNADIFQHTATARNGAFDLDLKPGARGRTVLRKSGVIDVYCRYHPGMTGRLSVGS
jgi:plastocyanin